jgi:Ca-activated chloride channel family protein
VRAQLKKLLGSLDRTSESSGWLRDLCFQEYDTCDAIFNYESHILELNQKLAQNNREPMYIVYSTPGLGLADFPLSGIDHGDVQKQKVFSDLQNYLLSDAVQNEIAAKCRRVGKVGVDKVDDRCFVPAWGADVKRGVTPLRQPDTAVIREALDLYQTTLRKPSFTIYALDFSGSMNGEGEKQLKAAMRTLLDQQEASKYLLQGTPDDITIVFLFDDQIINYAALNNYAVNGNSPVELDSLLTKIEQQQTRAATNIYRPVAQGLEWMKQKGIGERFPAVILMTDGQSNHGSLDDVKNAIARTGLENVPVYAITFGDADPAQLQTLVDLTHGRVFDGKSDLISAFRRAKGNN